MIEASLTTDNSLADPFKGPQTTGWKKYDPNDPTTLALLGNSLTGAELGNHVEADNTCDFWNDVLPIYPQVRGFRTNFITIKLICFDTDIPCVWKLDLLKRRP